MATTPEFQVMKNKDSRYYWHLEAGNSRLVAWSGQTYETKESCLTELYWIRENAASIPVYDYTGEGR